MAGSIGRMERRSEGFFVLYGGPGRWIDFRIRDGNRGIECECGPLCSLLSSGPNLDASKTEKEYVMADLRSKELMEKETALTLEIESLLPDFARSCRDNADVVPEWLCRGVPRAGNG
jgi:hypothetical protein